MSMGGVGHVLGASGGKGSGCGSRFGGRAADACATPPGRRPPQPRPPPRPAGGRRPRGVARPAPARAQRPPSCASAAVGCAVTQHDRAARRRQPQVHRCRHQHGQHQQGQRRLPARCGRGNTSGPGSTDEAAQRGHGAEPEAQAPARACAVRRVDAAVDGVTHQQHQALDHQPGLGGIITATQAGSDGTTPHTRPGGGDACGAWPDPSGCPPGS
jgi:hypothetical protein